jgi:arylformamidase
MTVYKNKPEKVPSFKHLSTHENGSSHETIIEMSLHTGTHIDYPLHMIKNGKVSDRRILDGLIGPAKVIECHQEVIDEAFIDDSDIQKGDVVLFKTRNSLVETFDFEFVYVSESAAKRLVEIGVKGVGLDALGIERAQENHPTHKQLLSQDIFIIEGLRLKDIVPKTYQMICLPLKIEGVEALPVRCLLED